MNDNRFDVIVLGVGGMGSATAFELADRGRRVLALEQYPLVHDRGSSHGQTRITRKAYYEHPGYVPLVRRAFERWYDLEQRTGRHLLTDCGCLCIGQPHSKLITGVQRSSQEHGIPIDFLASDDLRRRFPQFRFDDGFVGTLEREAGFLYVEECVRAHIDEARKRGAIVRGEERVIGWESTGESVSVRTTIGTYHAAKLVITAGSWATRFLAEQRVPLSVMRQILFWIGVSDPSAFRRDRFPLFIGESEFGNYYGFPVVDASMGLKVAQHYGAPELRDPDEVDWNVNDDDESVLRRFLREHMPGVDGKRGHASVCMYTLTPDRHFIIDRHPQYGNVAVAAGFSGHGFKFASVVGEILADLVDTGSTRWPIEMFRVGRFGNV